MALEFLTTIVNAQFTLAQNLCVRSPNVNDGAIESGFPCQMNTSAGTAALVHAEGGGLWVPYVENNAVCGYATAGAPWIASGPFSGCEFAVGKASDGRIFGAHIARQSGSTGPEDFDAYAKRHGLKIWFQRAVSVPSKDFFYSGRYLFASLAVRGDGIGELWQVDIRCTAMGSTSGKVFTVKKLDK